MGVAVSLCVEGVVTLSSLRNNIVHALFFTLITTMMKNYYLILAVLLLLASQSHSQSIPLIPLSTIEKGFTQPDSLRAKLLDLGFQLQKSNENEEEWILFFNDKYDMSNKQSYSFKAAKIACNIYSPFRNKIKSSIAIHFRIDKLPEFRKQYLQAIRKKYPLKHVTHVIEGIGTETEKDNYELEYYNKERYVTARIQDIDEQWTIITFTIPEQFLR